MPIPSLPAGLPRSSRMVVANRLHSAAIHLLRRARAVDRQSGISPERLSVLSVLVFAGPQTMSDLARIEMVSRPAITRLAKSLEQGGLVRRRSDRADRRRVQLRATAKGRALMERARALRVARVAEELEGLSQRELATLREATSILERHRSQRRAGGRAVPAPP